MRLFVKPEGISCLGTVISTNRDLRWRAIDIGTAFYMESPARNEQVKGVHCAACAYVEVINNYGGDADLRGLFRYGRCYQFLAVLVRQERDKRKKGTD